MIFRSAIESDIPSIASLERSPEFITFVGRWSVDRHLSALVDPNVAYLVVEDEIKGIAGFAILLGLQSEHKSLQLKRIVVGVPNQGLGTKLLHEIARKAFTECGMHRLWLCVFDHNARARHVYEMFGFREEGILREAWYQDGNYQSEILMSLLDREYNPSRIRRG